MLCISLPPTINHYTLCFFISIRRYTFWSWPFTGLSILQSLNLQACDNTLSFIPSLNHTQICFPQLSEHRLFIVPQFPFSFHSNRSFSWLHKLSVIFPNLPCSSVWPCDQFLADVICEGFLSNCQKSCIRGASRRPLYPFFSSFIPSSCWNIDSTLHYENKVIVEPWSE